MTTELEMLRAIAFSIANDDDPGDSNIEDWVCAYCGIGGWKIGYDDRRFDPANHKEHCEWRLSKAWRKEFGGEHD